MMPLSGNIPMNYLFAESRVTVMMVPMEFS